MKYCILFSTLFCSVVFGQSFRFFSDNALAFQQDAAGFTPIVEDSFPAMQQRGAISYVCGTAFLAHASHLSPITGTLAEPTHFLIIDFHLLTRIFYPITTLG